MKFYMEHTVGSLSTPQVVIVVMNLPDSVPFALLQKMRSTWSAPQALPGSRAEAPEWV